MEYSLVVFGFFIIAFLYSSVGFGGGSSYLALLSVLLGSFFAIRSTALLCNLVVVSGSCLLFFQKGHISFKKFLPFVVTSIPAAFLGALFRLGEHLFFILLGICLMASALALVVQSVNGKRSNIPKNYPPYLSYLLGSGIGLLSGMVGIGGGIFLAPILNHLKWDKPMVIAALASFFIFVNSISGLLGLALAGSLQLLWPDIVGLVLAVLLGGQLGVRLSIFTFSAKTIRLVTALLVLYVGIRVLIENGLQMEVLF